MKKIKLTSENAFLGAEISLGKETFYVVKVNEKSFWASRESTFLKAWEGRIKGIKWKNFCEGHQAKSYKYGDFEIAEEEAAKKEKVETTKKIQKEQKKYLTGQVKADVKKMWNQFLLREKKGRGKAWQYPIFSGDTSVNPIAASSQAEALLLHINDKYIFYYVNDDVYIHFDKEEHKLGKEIVWPVSPLEDVKSA